MQNNNNFPYKFCKFFWRHFMTGEVGFISGEHLDDYDSQAEHVKLA